MIIAPGKIPFEPGTMIVIDNDHFSKTPSVWQDDTIEGTEVVVSDLSRSDRMLVISSDDRYVFVLVRGRLGYVNSERVERVA